MTDPHPPAAGSGECPERFIVDIGLYRCSFDGKLFLCLDHRDGSGHRISGHKPVRGTLVESFRCDFTLADLKEASGDA